MTDTPNNTQAEIWDAAADGWDSNSQLINTWLRDATDRMMHAAGLAAGHHVLDIAAGAGDQTIDIARRVGPRGHVLAIDISPALVARAEANLARAGCTNAVVRVGNGEALGLASRFDSAICRLGLMFYANPLQGLREMRAALKPGGKAAALVFSAPEQNPLIVAQLAIAARHLGMPAPRHDQPGGLLSLGSAQRCVDLFTRAGFVAVNCDAISAPMSLPTASSYVDFLRTAAGPVVSLAKQLTIGQQTRLWIDLETAFARYQEPSGWRGPNELLLVSGVAPI